VPSDKFNDLLSELRTLVDTRLDKIVPSEKMEPVLLHSAIRWSLFAGGKRIRPTLVILTGEVFGAHRELTLNIACAFELIHTYSLIHDDLPSMDNDDLRRGRATCHVKFGEAAAVLAGDALQSLAFATISQDESIPADTRLKIIAELSRAAGTPKGMVAGQCFDIESEQKQTSPEELDRIHRFKTGAIISAAIRSGAIMGKATESDLILLDSFGEKLGLLFQITDDILDATSSAADLGKTPGKDAKLRKATYITLYGLDSTRERAEKVYMQALQELDKLSRPAENLKFLTEFIIKRNS
jgi:geranylgeranyl diphosphate synthase, type II